MLLNDNKLVFLYSANRLKTFQTVTKIHNKSISEKLLFIYIGLLCNRFSKPFKLVEGLQYRKNVFLSRIVEWLHVNYVFNTTLYRVMLVFHTYIYLHFSYSVTLHLTTFLHTYMAITWVKSSHNFSFLF